MPRTVELQQHALGDTALASAAIARRAMLARAGDAGGAEDPLHAFARQADALALGQQLSEVAVVDAAVSAAGEADHAARERLRDPVRGTPAVIAVDQPGRAATLEARLQTQT